MTMFSKKDGPSNRNGAGTGAGVAYTPTEMPRAPHEARPAAAPAPRPAERRMTVGPGIGLDGKITNCDILVVEGTVEATLECKNLEIAEGGKFNGEASVETAEINGEYDGTLTVSDLMRVHSTGQLSGKARYGKIEVAVGGEVSGDIAVQGHVARGHVARGLGAKAETAKPAALADAPTSIAAGKAGG